MRILTASTMIFDLGCVRGASACVSHHKAVRFDMAGTRSARFASLPVHMHFMHACHGRAGEGRTTTAKRQWQDDAAATHEVAAAILLRVVLLAPQFLFDKASSRRSWACRS